MADSKLDTASDMFTNAIEKARAALTAADIVARAVQHHARDFRDRVEIVIADPADGDIETRAIAFIDGQRVPAKVWFADPGQNEEDLQTYAQPELTPAAYDALLQLNRSFTEEPRCTKCGRTNSQDDSCADDIHGKHTF